MDGISNIQIAAPKCVEEQPMNSEIKELNRIICRQCDEKDYEKCKSCRVYQLVNKIMAQ
ncbi:MAG: hypothetical protein QHH12_04660 [Candidatus Bathyarchaeota archaeon]|nr:hypothetical protein [Candidatus Bathyarchaeota archaeon A05DMB-3]MDH7607044.1 hypothetical protein [Candidatus Bathyarchaeota archaeon]